MGTLLVRDHAASAAAVREKIAGDLRGRVHPDALDDVLLVATELVSNAVRHGGASTAGRTSFGATWELHGDEVFVGMEDPSPELPRVLPPDAFRPGGRGLAIVSAIASDWGVIPLPTGKRVWATVPVVRAHRTG